MADEGTFQTVDFVPSEKSVSVLVVWLEKPGLPPSVSGVEGYVLQGRRRKRKRHVFIKSEEQRDA